MGRHAGGILAQMTVCESIIGFPVCRDISAGSYKSTQ
jgi:hypothetical protein